MVNINAFPSDSDQPLWSQLKYMADVIDQTANSIAEKSASHMVRKRDWSLLGLSAILLFADEKTTDDFTENKHFLLESEVCMA